MNIILQPEYLQLNDFVKNLPLDFENLGTVLYKVRNEVRLIEVDGLKVVVKKFKVPHLINRIAYTFFRKSKARRSFEYSNTLITNGFGAAIPIAYSEYKRYGLLSESYYVSVFCAYNRDFNEFRCQGVEGREVILSDFAKFTARLHKSGIRHLDYGGGNILFETTESGTNFCLIDVNRLETGVVDIRKGCENFKLLYLLEDSFRFLINEYADCMGFDFDTCFQIISPYIYSENGK